MMIVYRQKMLFILPQTPPETTGRSFLLACKALYMKISGSPGEKVVFWAVVPPPELYCLYLKWDIIDLYFTVCVMHTLCMYIFSVEEQL